MIDRRTLLAAGPALAALPLPGWASANVGLFDAHAHLVSDDLANFPRSGEARLQPDEPAARAEAVLAWMSAAGVQEGACIQHKAIYGDDNRYILASADAHRRNLAPVVVLDAQDAAAPDKLRTWTRTHGLAGVRLTGPFAEDYGDQWLDSEAALRTWAAADALGLLVELTYLPGHHAPATMDRIAALSERFPRCAIVMGHIGWPEPEAGAHRGDGLLPMTAHRGVFFKLTTANLSRMTAAGRDPAVEVRRIVDRLGAERLCWGSDIGASAGSYAQMVEAALRATALLSPAERRWVLGETGRRLYRRRVA